MKERIQKCAAVSVIAVFLCAGAFGIALAQTQCVSTSDATCTDEDNCVTKTNCTRVQFTADYTGTYAIRAYSQCSGSSACSNCHSCVNLYEYHGSESFIANCHNDNCDNQHECTQVCNVSLTEDVVYALYVCLQPCPDGSDCEDCGNDCNAYGAVYYPILLPCP